MRLAFKELSIHSLTTGPTSDLEVVSWSQLSGCLYLCWELECKVFFWLHPQGKDKCLPLPHFPHNSHTPFPQSLRCSNTYKHPLLSQYTTHSNPMDSSGLSPLYSAFHQQLNSPCSSLITSGYFCFCSLYHS